MFRDHVRGHVARMPSQCDVAFGALRDCAGSGEPRLRPLILPIGFRHGYMKASRLKLRNCARNAIDEE
jgi:hypothetical protein